MTTQDRLNRGEYTSFGRTANSSEQIFRAMVECSTRRDRLCFASQSTLAEMVGCSRRTVIRCQKQLEAEGRIERRPNRLPSGQVRSTCVWGFPVGVRRLPKPAAPPPSHRGPLGPSHRSEGRGNGAAAPTTRVEGGWVAEERGADPSGVGPSGTCGKRRVSAAVSHDCSSNRTSKAFEVKSKTTELTFRRAHARHHPPKNKALRGRMRRMSASDQLFPTQHLVVRKDGGVSRFNAGDAIAAVVDVCNLDDVRIPARLKARLGRSARLLLEDGEWTPEEIVTALVQGVRTARVDLVEQYLLERELLVKRGYIADPKDPWSPEQSATMASDISEMRNLLLKAMGSQT